MQLPRWLQVERKKQCCHRWKYTLDPIIDRTTRRTGTWTEAEDIKLKDSVERHGGKNWCAIATLVPDRSRGQCRGRWRYAMHSGIALEAGRAGKWTVDEDNKLKDSVLTHGGKNWIAITALIPGRTRVQCYERWHDVLDPSIDWASGRTGKWSEDEDTMLKDTVLRHGDKSWKEIAALVPGRTNKQCCSRWRDMEPNGSTVRGEASGTLKKAPALRQSPHPP
jgi:myb proto-oncogene protein